MQPVKWTERKFLFGYDKSYVPFLIERLRSTAPRLDELLQGCSDKFASTADKTGWTIKEHIGHLSDLEQLHDKRIDDFINGETTLSPADMANKATYAAGHNSKPASELLAEFRHVRNAYLQRLENMDEHWFNKTAMHPRLKQTITLADMLYFVAEHDNHHLTKVANALQRT